MKYLFALAGVAAILSTSAFAEETVVKERTGPGPGVEVKGPGVGVREHDCASKTVHKEDGAGDSTTVHKESCD